MISTLFLVDQMSDVILLLVMTSFCHVVLSLLMGRCKNSNLTCLILNKLLASNTKYGLFYLSYFINYLFCRYLLLCNTIFFFLLFLFFCLYLLLLCDAVFLLLSFMNSFRYSLLCLLCLLKHFVDPVSKVLYKLTYYNHDDSLCPALSLNHFSYKIQKIPLLWTMTL